MVLAQDGFEVVRELRFVELARLESFELPIQGTGQAREDDFHQGFVHRWLLCEDAEQPLGEAVRSCALSAEDPHFDCIL